MDPTASIRKLGFRRWYERQLILCHAALVTCLLCGLTMAALLETVDFRSFGWTPASRLVIVFAAGAVGWISWKTYIRILQRAEFYGESSNCPACKTYGRFTVISTGMDHDPGRVAEAVAPLEAAWMRVECKKCGAAWRMPE